MKLLRTAVIYVTYGAYHQAWSNSLAEIEGIEPHFIELTPRIGKHPWWHMDKTALPFPLTTLAHSPYEKTSHAKYVKKIVSSLRSIRPDAVVAASYNPPAMLAAARWAKKNKAASIMKAASTVQDHTRVWWKEAIKRSLVQRYYDAGFANGTASMEYLVGLGLPKEHIWDRQAVVDNQYFAVEAARARETMEGHREAAGLPRRYFLYVGRFSPEKNVMGLLQAYRRYRELKPDGWQLMLVGDGPQREELKQTARNLKLEGLVWPGYKQIYELPLYYALAGAFVLPSVSEPWGLVVNEAMACGLPVLVSTRCGSSCDLVRVGENGYTFDPFNVEDLAECMVNFSDSSTEERSQMADSSREIISHYTPEARAESLADCIRQTVTRIRGQL